MLPREGARVYRGAVVQETTSIKAEIMESNLSDEVCISCRDVFIQFVLPQHLMPNYLYLSITRW